jgi:hypothetical protein
MSLMNKLTQIAKSDKGKELIEKAQTFANDPKTRQKIEDARGKIEDQIDAAKHKLAEKRGDKEGSEPTAAPSPTTPPPAGPTTTPPPSYGGDEGPKAA